MSSIIHNRICKRFKKRFKRNRSRKKRSDYKYPEGFHLGDAPSDFVLSFIDFLREGIVTNSNPKALDLFGFTGRHIPLLQSLHGEMTVTLADVRGARPWTEPASLKHGVELKEVGIADFSALKSLYYQVIIDHRSLHHCTSLFQLHRRMEEMRRILAPGGRILCSVRTPSYPFPPRNSNKMDRPVFLEGKLPNGQPRWDMYFPLGFAWKTFTKFFDIEDFTIFKEDDFLMDDDGTEKTITNLYLGFCLKEK